MREGIWEKQMAHSIEGKTLGIIGLGKIGTQVVKRAHAFDMQIVYHSRNRNIEIEERYDMKYVALDELLGMSDFVTLHVPLTDQTRGMICRDKLHKMKANAILINTARGALVDVMDLCDALDQRVIAGAAIDVFDEEPCTNSVIRKQVNAVLTPHIGSFTRETFIKMDVAAAQNVIDYLSPFTK